MGLPPVRQRGLAEETVRKGLSVRALERRIRAAGKTPKPSTEPTASRDPDIRRLEQRVGELVGAETRVEYAPAKGRGQIAFRFHSLEALEGILERLGYREH